MDEGFQPNRHSRHQISSNYNYNSSRRGRGGGGGRRRWNNSNSFNPSHSVAGGSGSSSNREEDITRKDKDDDLLQVQGLKSIVGTCPFMCPADERAQRERLRDLAIFERLDGNPAKTSPNLAVKKFCRTISTKHVQASDVRPLLVLEETLNYLLSLLDSEGRSFEVLHEFIFDRTRSIRQDLSMQDIIGDKAIHMYERMVKFHIVSHHKLQRCTGSSDISPMHHLNLEQLTKALTSLYNLYDTNRACNLISANETEFRSFYVFLHLGSDSQPTAEALTLWFRRIPYFIINSHEMKFARRLLRFYRMGDYKRFIHSTEAEASYLQYYIIEPYISKIRAFALSCVNYGGYKLYPYPLVDLSEHLLMEESDVESLCSDCGLTTCTSETGTKLLPTKQTNLSVPKRGFHNHYPLKSEKIKRACAGLLG